MNASNKKTLVLLGAAIVGALGGKWVAPRVGATFGLTFGPMGVAAGAIIGAIAGAAIGSAFAGEVDFPELEDVPDHLGLRSDL